MDIKKWIRDKFLVDSELDWNCPNCTSGKLEIEKEKFNSQETKVSKEEDRKQDYWEPDFIRYRFSGSLKCKLCDEIIVFIGSGQVVNSGYYDQIEETYYGDYREEFKPLFFHPPLHIFKLKSSYPKEVSQEIMNSFEHFWNDLSSCANKIRTSLEILLNLHKVKNYTLTNRNKRKRLTLHQRIEEFKKKNSEVGDYLLAIKWIGNEGSHPGNLERIDILETYELLEHSLDKLYERKDEKMKRLSKEINRNKGVKRRKSVIS